jgi:tRNA threonylcarbamoyladenosine biosynthesis protein TsaE
MSETHFLHDEAAMLAFGARLGQNLQPGTLVFLCGDLGAGKTTLVRGMLRGRGYQGAVKSPTYTLVEEYPLRDLLLYHFDLYRLGAPEELEYMGIRDYLGPQSVALVEWPDKGAGILPQADLVIEIAYQPPGRQLSLRANSALGEALIEAAQ